jgi:hypothetical protein
VSYEYDESEWPVVQFKFVGRLSDSELENYLRDADALVNGERTYACVMNGLDMLTPEIEFVRRQAKWIAHNAQAMRRVNRGIAMVSSSAMIRGLVRAVLHLQALPVPSQTFSELAEGIAWARALATATTRPRAND